MSDKLLPCPFCSQKGPVTPRLYQRPGWCSWSVHCINCWATTGQEHSEADAIKAWNNAVPMHEQTELYLELAKDIGEQCWDHDGFDTQTAARLIFERCKIRQEKS